MATTGKTDWMNERSQPQNSARAGHEKKGRSRPEQSDTALAINPNAIRRATRPSRTQ